jgi:hypothetical protein
MQRSVFIGGIKTGVNYPDGQTFLHIGDWKDVIVVDRTFFLEHKDEIEKWALD